MQQPPTQYSHPHSHFLLPHLATLILACLLSSAAWGQENSQSPLNHQTLADSLSHLQQHPLRAIHAGKELTADALLATLADKQVILVGEQHDRYDHHLNQLAILHTLHQKNPKITIAVEWFQQPFQPVLDAYLAGNLDEAELLRQSEYYSRWGYDFRQIRPLLAYAKQHKLPVLALNAPVELTRKVGKGGLQALDASERAQLPPDITPAPAAYRTRLAAVFHEHGMDGDAALDNFVWVQRVWDETMAYNIVRHLQAQPERQIIVFAGVGHMSDGMGIPADVQRRLPQVRLVTLASADATETHPPKVDYVLPTTLATLPPNGKLGVLLDEEGKTLTIKALDKNSAADKAGLRKGDRLAQINGTAIQSMADLKLALAQHTPGSMVEVTVERHGTEIAHTVMLQ